MKTVEQILDDGFTKFVEAQEKSILLHDEKVAKVREETKAEIADLEKRADGWLAEIRKEFRQGGAFRTTGATSDTILDVLDEKTKGMIPMAEAVCRGQGAVISRDGRVKFSADQEKTVNARPFYDDPILKVACGKWLQTHIQKQQRPADFSGERREAHEKLTMVLNGRTRRPPSKRSRPKDWSSYRPSSRVRSSVSSSTTRNSVPSSGSSP